MPGKIKFLIGEKNLDEFLSPYEYEAEDLDVYSTQGTTKIVYDSEENVSQVIYYKNATQTVANRIGQVDITFDANELPITVVSTYYDSTDGTILLKTVTESITYVSEEPDTISVVHS